MSRRARSTLRILPRIGRIAWVSRERPCLAVPPAESPSTMKSSAFAGSRSWQSASLPGRLWSESAPLRRARSRALPRRRGARAASCTFATSGFATGRVLLEVVAELLVEEPLDQPRTSLVPSLVLVCPSNSGCGSFTEMTAVRPFAGVVAGGARGAVLAVLVPGSRCSG